MGLLSWSYVLLFSSLLSIAVGFGLVTRKIVAERYQLFIFIIVLVFSGYLSSYIGSWLGNFVPHRFNDVFAGLIFMGCGAYLLKVKPSYPDVRDQLLFVSILALEVSTVSYRFGHVNHGSLPFVLFLICVVLGSVVGGMLMGGRRWGSWKLKLFLPHAAGVLFIILGLIKVI